jgi:Tfp pilus assembly protein PilF
VIGLAYGNSLFNGFVYDDELVIVQNPTIQRLSQIPELFTHDYWGGVEIAEAGLRWADPLYRPLTMATYALNFSAGGLDPVGYHLINLLLHLLVSWLVYRLARQLRLSSEAALIAALLFAVHPIHTEAVTGIVGRAELLMSASILAGLLFAAEGQWSLSILAFVAGLLSKEQAVVLPALLWLYAVCLSRAKASQPDDLGMRRGGLALRLSAYCGVLGLYLYVRTIVLGTWLTPRTDFLANPLVAADWGSRMLTAITVGGQYLWLCIWPASLSADYSYNSIPMVRSMADHRFWVAFIMWAALFTAAWKSFAHDARVGFLVGFTALTFLPASNLLLPIGVMMGERLFYLPSAGLCLLVGWAWHRLYSDSPAVVPPAYFMRSRLICLVLVGMISLGLTVRTIVRNTDWADSETLHRSTIEVVPQNGRAHELLGEVLMRKGDFAQAHEAFGAALRIVPTYAAESPIFASNYGVVLLQLNKLNEAATWFENALAFYPNWSTLRLNLGHTYLRQRRLEEAEQSYRQALIQNPKSVAAYDSLSLLESAQGRYAEALALADAALSIDPELAQTHFARARAYEGLERIEEAITSYRQTLALNPKSAEAEKRLRALAAQ